MLKKFNSFMSLSIAYTGLFFILGIVIMLFPEQSLTIATYAVAITSIIFGIIIVTKLNSNLFLFRFSTMGVLLIVVGVVTLIQPNIIKTVIPIIIGIFIIMNSIFKLKLSLILKKNKINTWILTALLACLSIVCGSIMIINPELGILSLTMSLGALLVIYSTTDFVNLVVFKRNINVIVKELE